MMESGSESEASNHGNSEADDSDEELSEEQ